MCLLRDESTGTPEPVETSLNRNLEAPQPARGGTSTGTGVPTTEGFTDRHLQVCVADLALSKLKVPLKVDTYAQEAELEAKVAALSATHDEEAMRTALDTVPAASVPFAGELVKLIKAHQGEPGGREPACERCQGTARKRVVSGKGGEVSVRFGG